MRMFQSVGAVQKSDSELNSLQADYCSPIFSSSHERLQLMLRCGTQTCEFSLRGLYPTAFSFFLCKSFTPVVYK